MELTRRTLLGTVSTGSIAALAGCSGGENVKPDDFTVRQSVTSDSDGELTSLEVTLRIRPVCEHNYYYGAIRVRVTATVGSTTKEHTAVLDTNNVACNDGEPATTTLGFTFGKSGSVSVESEVVEVIE